jgi:hypothetical protein
MGYFESLNANRKAEAAVWGIFRIKKDGTVSAKPTATERTQEYAIQTRDRIAGYNPTNTYIIRSL